MRRTLSLFGPCILTVAILAPLTGTGCAGRVRIYDEEHRDYHRWDDREDRSYRRYLAERHEEYREFSQRSHEEQRDYWNWRHNHPDADR
jgi:hypothetical protein